jgi:uncharacterized repeat protein (TIGR03803 family)
VFKVTMAPRPFETVLHSFQGGPSDGAYPYAGLIDVGGTLYGTTFEGGASGHGTVFKVTPPIELFTVNSPTSITTMPATPCDMVHEWRDGYEAYGCRPGNH